MAIMANDDRSEIEQYYWQTDVFDNMDIDEVHNTSSTISVHREKYIYITNVNAE